MNKPAPVKVIAHRGESSIAPENTMAAFQLGLENGADGIEGDFRLTKDEQIVCIHDADTNRTGNRNLSIETSTLEQLEEIDVGSWKNISYSNERIPTLHKILESLPDQRRILIEVKSDSQIIPHLKNVLQNHASKIPDTIVMSFDHQLVRDFKDQMPSVTCIWIIGFKRNFWKLGRRPSKSSILNRLKVMNVDGINCRAEASIIDKPFVNAIHEMGKQFHVWTIDDVNKARHFENLGVDSITTNHPKKIREELERLRQNAR